MFKKSLFFAFYALAVVVLFCAVQFSLIDSFYLSFLLIISFLPVFCLAIYEVFHGILGTEFFVSIASIVGFISGEIDTIIAILLIMLIAKFFETLIDEKTDKAIDSLLELMPQEAIVELGENNYKIINIKQVIPMMTVIVKAGGRIPADGKISYGFASINESSLTGESFPKEKGVGNDVFAGTFVENGMIKFLVEKAGDDTLFSKMKKGIESFQKSKAKISIYASNIATILVPIILIFIFLVWLITRNSKLVVTLLVFGSPLELTLITPLAILAGVISAFRQGILVKGGSALEKLASVDVFAFDKTGTLTAGDIDVVEIVSLDPSYSVTDILTLAAIAEKNSEHLIAKAVLNKAKFEKIDVPDAENFESRVGFGVKMQYLGNTYFLGSKKFADFLGISIFGPCITAGKIECNDDGFHTSFYLFSEKNVIGRICILDQIRDDTKIILQNLRQIGIKRLLLLSGDNQKIVESVANKLDLRDFYGDLLPGQKAEIIRKLQSEKFKLAMVGDGINDAPALRQADVGIVFGAMGMQPAIEAGDIVLMSNDLNKLLFVVGLSKKIMSIIKQNILFGFMMIHFGGMALAFLGIINPIQAALFHAFSDFLVLINSFRIIRFKNSSNPSRDF